MKSSPTHSTHTHCQVAQKANRTSQNLSKSMAAPTHGQKKIKHESTTMAIRNAGFSGNLKVIAINKIYGRLKGLWVQIPHYA